LDTGGATHQARRAYRDAFLQFKMVSYSTIGSYSGGAVSLPCKPGRREGGVGLEVRRTGGPGKLLDHALGRDSPITKHYSE
jgi:hypothetical protein